MTLYDIRDFTCVPYLIQVLYVVLDSLILYILILEACIIIFCILGMYIRIKMIKYICVLQCAWYVFYK